MKTYNQIYMVETPKGDWIISEDLTEDCRETSTEYNRSYPGYICTGGMIHYRDQVLDDNILIYCLHKDDVRLKEIDCLLCEIVFKNGKINNRWFHPGKYLEGKMRDI